MKSGYRVWYYVQQESGLRDFRYEEFSTEWQARDFWQEIQESASDIDLVDGGIQASRGDYWVDLPFEGERGEVNEARPHMHEKRF